MVSYIVNFIHFLFLTCALYWQKQIFLSGRMILKLSIYSSEMGVLCHSEMSK